MSWKKFKHGDKDEYSLAKNGKLQQQCVKYKEEYEKKVETNKNYLIFNKTEKNTHSTYQYKNMLVVQYQSAKLRGLRELVSRMDRVGVWVRGCVGGVSQSLAWMAWVTWVHKVLAWVSWVV